MEMYRDDKGGWIRASELEGLSHKVVGKDFRGLPIIHIGRGRPKTSIIKLLMQDPNITAQTCDSNDTVQKGLEESNLLLLSHADEQKPRVSERLQLKRELRASRTATKV